MDLLARELPTGRWDALFDGGVADALLEAAIAANECVQGYAAAYHAESVSSQEIDVSRLAGERGAMTGIRHASAVRRYAVAAECSDGLLREWARMALHLARITTLAWQLITAPPPAAAGGGHVWLRDITPVSALYDSRDPLLATLAALPPRSGEPDDGPGQDLHSAYQRIVAAVGMAAAHGTPPELFDRPLSGDHDAIAGLGLLDLAGALHDYGARRLWLLAAHTPTY